MVRRYFKTPEDVKLDPPKAGKTVIAPVKPHCLLRSSLLAIILCVQIRRRMRVNDAAR
jgi:cytochrome c-type biogenesis protein CcmH/NrfF